MSNINIQLAAFDVASNTITLEDGNTYTDINLNSLGKGNSSGVSIIDNEKAIYVANISEDLVSILDKFVTALDSIFTLATTPVVNGSPVSVQVGTDIQALKVEVEQLKESLK